MKLRFIDKFACLLPFVHITYLKTGTHSAYIFFAFFFFIDLISNMEIHLSRLPNIQCIPMWNWLFCTNTQGKGLPLFPQGFKRTGYKLYHHFSVIHLHSHSHKYKPKLLSMLHQIEYGQPGGHSYSDMLLFRPLIFINQVNQTAEAL